MSSLIDDCSVLDHKPLQVHVSESNSERNSESKLASLFSERNSESKCNLGEGEEEQLRLSREKQSNGIYDFPSAPGDNTEAPKTANAEVNDALQKCDDNDDRELSLDEAQKLVASICASYNIDAPSSV